MNSYEDTAYMLQLAAEKEWVGAVVGWVPLNIPSVANFGNMLKIPTLKVFAI
jgi:L-fuconolactonase